MSPRRFVKRKIRSAEKSIKSFDIKTFLHVMGKSFFHRMVILKFLFEEEIFNVHCYDCIAQETNELKKNKEQM